MKKIEKGRGEVVYVGLSGGVDSSVAALLLKQQGYNVRGVFIKTWQPDYIECTWKEDRLDAMRVAAQLDIPFETLDFEKEYKESVVDYMISEYMAGRTPNPDIMCNKYVKFGAFYKYVKSIDSSAMVATGHYARVVPISLGEGLGASLSLSKAKDQSKDQVYFLSQINKEIFKDILFPLGDKLKSEVRQIAKDKNLFVAEKKDSQGICMLGDISMKDFLKKEIEERIKHNSHLAHLLHKGDIFIKDMSDHNLVKVGTQNGAIFYTIGERIHVNELHNADSQPYFVIDKDIMRNQVYVSTNKEEKNKGRIYSIKMWNYTSNVDLKGGSIYEGQTRYHGEMHRFKVVDYEMCLEMDDIMNLSDDREISFNYNVKLEVLDENTLMVSGQTIVLYNGNIMIGGGIIS